jgi:hypothetical protein
MFTEHMQLEASRRDSYLKLPMPKPEVLDQALKALSSLFESLRG